MKYIFLLILTIPLLSLGQTKVYKTEEDYTSGKGEVMDSEYKIWTNQSTFGNLVKFKTLEGNGVSYNPKHIWGFHYRGYFFRTVGKELAMLTDTGSVNYFINGYAGIGFIHYPDRTESDYFPGQSSCYVSIGNLTSKVYKIKGDYRELKEDFPDFDDLYDCIDESRNILTLYQTTKKCVVEFNKRMEKKNKRK